MGYLYKCMDAWIKYVAKCLILLILCRYCLQLWARVTCSESSRKFKKKGFVWTAPIFMNTTTDFLFLHLLITWRHKFVLWKGAISSVVVDLRERNIKDIIRTLHTYAVRISFNNSGQRSIHKVFLGRQLTGLLRCFKSRNSIFMFS